LASVFSDEEIRELERLHPDGLPAATVVEQLRRRGVDLAEATFRKYVQLGLLPRSRRVGRKGKHRGSHGLYPVACVTRVAQIRQLMDSGLTLEDIQRSALSFSFEVDTLRRTADDIVSRLSDELVSRGSGRAAATSRKLASLRTQADALAAALDQVAHDICPVAPEVWHTDETVSQSRGSRMARQATAGRTSSKKPAGARPGQSRAGANR
jgi:DNA-binding transcriptional MerR regulator